MFQMAQTYTVGEYTTSGATVNAALIPGLTHPTWIAASGDNLFVMSGFFQPVNTRTIGEYTASGATVNASLITTGLDSQTFNGIAVSGGNLLVAKIDQGAIAQYTTSGAELNAALITGLHLALLNGTSVAVADAVVSVWTSTSNANWADSGNWSNTVPGATTGTSNADTALFDQNVTFAPVIIDKGRNLEYITFDGATVPSLTVGASGGPALLLTAGGAIQTTSTVVSLQRINAPLVLEGDYSFTSGATSNSAVMSFGGKITPAATTGITTLTLNGGNTGPNTISGALADNGGGRLAINKSDVGVWIIAGANKYSGNTTISEGTLIFNVEGGTHDRVWRRRHGRIGRNS